MSELPLNKRKNFKEIELGFTEEIAIEEAKRCLRCGFCAECSECSADCDKRLVALSISGETSGMLLRVPLDLNQFPLNSSPLQGKLSLDGAKFLPVIVEPITAKVISDLCRGCGDCEKVCEYSAPKLNVRAISDCDRSQVAPTYDNGNGVKICSIDETSCKGCGVCASICPSSAIIMNHFSNKQIANLIKQAIDCR